MTDTKPPAAEQRDFRAELESGECKPNHGCNIAIRCMCALAEEMADEIDRLRVGKAINTPITPTKFSSAEVEDMKQWQWVPKKLSLEMLKAADRNPFWLQSIWDTLLAAAPSPPATEMWPIETAPRDGSLIFLMSAEYPPRIHLGKWNDKGTSWVDENGLLGGDCYTLADTGIWESGGGWFQPNEVTHWCPLPMLESVASGKSLIRCGEDDPMVTQDRSDTLASPSTYLDHATIERCAEVMDRRAAIWRNSEQGPCSLPLEEECEDGAAAIRALKSESGEAATKEQPTLRRGTVKGMAYGDAGMNTETAIHEGEAPGPVPLTANLLANASASRRDEPSPETEQEVMPLGAERNSRSAISERETSPQPTGASAPAGATPLLPVGAVILGPNTISGLPHKGGSGDFCPPWREPQFDNHAARVAIWFNTWNEAQNFMTSILSHTAPSAPSEGEIEAHTKIFQISPAECQNYSDMLIALWPGLKWRHAGFGALQAYIREGDERELRVHIWHPSLIKPGIEESGLCHDHRFDMRSSVLVGKIIQTEFSLEPDQAGDWETLRVLHAREAMARGGSFHHDPIPTGDYYRRAPTVYEVAAGNAYTFDKFAFHETRAEGVTITLVEKSAQEDVNARILAPRGRPVVHAFTETQTSTEFARALADGLAALRRHSPAGEKGRE